MSVTHPVRSASRQALRNLLFKVCAHDDPSDDPIAPIGDNDYTTLTRIIPSALAVLHVASHIEQDADRVMDWYYQTHIAELGFLTAEQLVGMGRAPIVIAFLHSIRCGERG